MWQPDTAALALVWTLCERFLVAHGAILLLGSWVLTGLATVVAYRQQQDGARSLRGWLRFCFPREFLHHPSCRLDMIYSAWRAVLHPLIFAPMLVGHLAIATGVYLGLAAWLGPQTPRALSPAIWVGIVLLCIVVQDAVEFHAHYLEHKIRVLWEVHKVHHSIEFLMPVCSGRRVHPFEDLLNESACSVVVGALLGGLSYAMQLGVQDNLIAGADAYIVANALSFSHLRHSHIKLSYGWLERFLISPRQHHIHHSYETALWDKNFGTLFSIWDRLWGTLVYSDAVGTFPTGLPAECRGEYDRAWKLYLMPIRNIARLVWRARPAARPGLVRGAP